MVKNSDRFLNAFNSIELFLKKAASLDKNIPFSDLISRVSQNNSIVLNYRDDLRKFGVLRNAIVHTSIENYVIAEPHLEIVLKMELILHKLNTPKRVSDYFKHEIYTIESNDYLSNVVVEMTKRDYSQAPVIENGVIVSMLNSIAITHWLGSKVKDAIISIGDTKVSEVLQCSNTNDNFLIINENEPLMNVRDIFVKSIGLEVPLEALIITENGCKNERPIGIITRSEDLSIVVKEIA